MFLIGFPVFMSVQSRAEKRGTLIFKQNRAKKFKGKNIKQKELGIGSEAGVVGGRSNLLARSDTND